MEGEEIGKDKLRLSQAKIPKLIAKVGIFIASTSSQNIILVISLSLFTSLSYNFLDEVGVIKKLSLRNSFKIQPNLGFHSSISSLSCCKLCNFGSVSSIWMSK